MVDITSEMSMISGLDIVLLSAKGPDGPPCSDCTAEENIPRRLGDENTQV